MTTEHKPVTAEEIAEALAVDRITAIGPGRACDLLNRLARDLAAARADAERLRDEAEEAKLGDRLSEDRTSDLWDAIEAVAEGCSPEQWAKHRATLDTNGTDAEPLETIRAELASLREALAEIDRLRAEIDDEEAARCYVRAHAEDHFEHEDTYSDAVRSARREYVADRTNALLDLLKARLSQ